MRVLKPLLFSAFLIVGFISYGFFVGPRLGHAKAKGEAVRELSAAKTPLARTNAVGGKGIVIGLTNGTWLAIRYRDSHSIPGYSCAITLDSEGKWLESDYHFCGQLAYGRELLDLGIPQQGDTNNPQYDLTMHPVLDQVMTSPDLATARARLMKHYKFTRLEP